MRWSRSGRAWSCSAQASRRWADLEEWHQTELAPRLLATIEVEATASPRLADCAHLRTFRAEYGSKARAGLLLHAGSSVEWLTADVLAALWWRVLCPCSSSRVVNLAPM
jgi:hypothetical protein